MNFTGCKLCLREPGSEGNACASIVNRVALILRSLTFCPTDSTLSSTSLQRFGLQMPSLSLPVHIQFATTAWTSEICNCSGQRQIITLVRGNHWSGPAPSWGLLCTQNEPWKPHRPLPNPHPWPAVSRYLPGGGESPVKANRCGICSQCPLGCEGHSRNRPYKSSWRHRHRQKAASASV